jgi:hypothetical protein
MSDKATVYFVDTSTLGLDLSAEDSEQFLRRGDIDADGEDEYYYTEGGGIASRNITWSHQK